MGTLIKKEEKTKKDNDIEIYNRATMSFIEDVIKNPDMLKSKDIYKKAKNYIRKEKGKK